MNEEPKFTGHLKHTSRLPGRQKNEDAVLTIRPSMPTLLDIPCCMSEHAESHRVQGSTNSSYLKTGSSVGSARQCSICPNERLPPRTCPRNILPILHVWGILGLGITDLAQRQQRCLCPSCHPKRSLLLAERIVQSICQPVDPRVQKLAPNSYIPISNPTSPLESPSLGRMAPK